MRVLFSATQVILVKVEENPSQFFMARFLYYTLDTAIARIIHMKDYFVFKTTEVVGHLPPLHL